MFEFLRAYQTEMMLVLSGICAMVALFACVTRYPSKARKVAQILMALSAMLLLIGEVLGEQFYGVATPVGFWMARICNFVVFITMLLIIQAFTMYLTDMVRIDFELPVPKRLYVTAGLILVGEALVIISQFTGLYYTFDAMNVYHRSSAYAVSYIFPLLALLLLLSVILQYRKQMRPRIWVTMALFAVVPLIASIIQLFTYGIYLTDMATVGMVVVLYLFALADINITLERAKEREVQLLKADQEHTQKLFSETAIALVSAIDAKDAYTHGHSSRVADYSKMIAAECGKDENECDDIYYAALLHDVGKIGIPDYIINKQGKLTPEEYDMIKSHPVVGHQILSQISDFPYLAIGARHHHERFDGAGYPDGLKGQDIPELARIISVADAYDAMTSNRSYRRQLPQEAVRDEFVRCSGSQFDPHFAQIMVQLIDNDPDYTMRER